MTTEKCRGFYVTKQNEALGKAISSDFILTGDKYDDYIVLVNEGSFSTLKFGVPGDETPVTESCRLFRVHHGNDKTHYVYDVTMEEDKRFVYASDDMVSRYKVSTHFKEMRDISDSGVKELIDSLFEEEK